MKTATKEFLEKIDKLSEERKIKIREAKSEYPTDGTIYYVSENGNDNNDGLSPATAFKTLEKAGSAELSEGDVILLERGSFFRGHIRITTPGVTLSAYGEGKKPIICGSPENGAKPHYWELVEGTENIYKYYKPLCDMGGIVFDEGKVAAIKRTPHFIDGKFINAQKKCEFDLKNDLVENYTFFCEVKKGEPCGALYLKCNEGNPGAVFKSIEFLARGNTVAPAANNITIDNVCILYCGTHSIGTGTVNGLTVRNTEIGWGGGCLQFYTESGYPVRFGNGIEIYGGCKDFTVENCYIYQIYDAGITHQYHFGSEDGPTISHINVTYKNNLVEYCIYNLEYFLEQNGHNDQIMKNVVFKDNILRFAGYGWGSYYSRACHICGWEHRNISENFVIENNIFDRGRSMIYRIGVQEREHLPTLRGNTYIHSVEGERNLGRYMERGCTTFCHLPERIPYTEENVLELVKDEGAEVYYSTEEPKCSGFWPSGMER